MDYESRKKKIGERIKQKRTALNLEKKVLLSKIYMSETSHKTLTAWENGERLPDLDSLVRMADVFKCDVGYLLCDYDEPNKRDADVAKETGLTGSAANAICNLDRTQMAAIGETPICYTDTLSKLCESSDFRKFLFELSAAVHYAGSASIGYEDFLKEVQWRLGGSERNEISKLTQQQLIDLVYPLNKYMGTVALWQEDAVEHHLMLACDTLKGIMRKIIENSHSKKSTVPSK